MEDNVYFEFLVVLQGEGPAHFLIEVAKYDSVIRDSRANGIGNRRGVQSPLLNSWIGERYYHQCG